MSSFQSTGNINLSHVLIVDGMTPSKIDAFISKNCLFENDFLARRHQVLKEYNELSNKTKKEKDLSTQDAASLLEQALVSCCYASTTSREVFNDDDDDDADAEDDEISNTIDDCAWSTVPGALARSRITTFVGRVALHCHTLGSRTLALAILERTQEADAAEKVWWHSDNDGIIYYDDEDTDELTLPKRSRRSADKAMSQAAAAPATNAPTDAPMEPNIKSNVLVECMSPDVVRVQRKRLRPRLGIFLQAGGLRILARWLAEATTPVPKQPQQLLNGKKSAPTTSSPSSQVDLAPSSTGPLLLPLLVFLEKLPFDVHIIKQSRINKSIKALSKQLDSLLSTTRKGRKKASNTLLTIEKSFKTIGDEDNNEIIDESKPMIKAPVAGGLSVVEVQAAVTKLMQTWDKQAATRKRKASLAAFDPFASLQSLLEERAQQLRQYESQMEEISPDGLPDWLRALHFVHAQKQTSTLANGNNTVSSNNTPVTNANTTAANLNAPITHKKPKETKELAQRERANERAAMMREDLAKAQHQRRELLRQLRQRQVESSSGSSGGNHHSGGKSVSWRDGLGATSRNRNRDSLEEVFIFVRDKDIVALEEEKEQSNIFEGDTSKESVTTSDTTEEKEKSTGNVWSNELILTPNESKEDVCTSREFVDELQTSTEDEKDDSTWQNEKMKENGKESRAGIENKKISRNAVQDDEKCHGLYVNLDTHRANNHYISAPDGGMEDGEIRQETGVKKRKRKKHKKNWMY